MAVDHWNVVRSVEEATTTDEHLARIYWELAELRHQVTQMSITVMKGLPLDAEMRQMLDKLTASLEAGERQLQSRLRGS